MSSSTVNYRCAPLPPGSAPARTATAMRRAMDRGEITPTDVVEECAHAIGCWEERVRAWTHIDVSAARSRAAALPVRPSQTAALHGVPVGLKDNIDTSDMPTGYGSRIYADYQPGRDAACAASIRLAGGVVLGKTVSTEFAHREPGDTRNPWNLDHTPGGSSSGSAAAVACGMVPLALGTQTTGSVIRPAAYCGVVGYKPSYGEFNAAGVLANTPSFDTLGVMARCVPDLVLMRRALLDTSIPDLRDVSIAGMRIGICRTPYWEQASAATQTLIETVASRLENAGARIVDVDEHGAFDGLEQANLDVSGYEFARSLAHERHHHYARLSEILRDGRMADGLVADYSSYVRAANRLSQARQRLQRGFEDVDILVTPSAPGAAPVGLAATGSAVFNMAWTTLHVPAVTLPIAWDEAGLPLGVQLIAARHDDDRLLSFANSAFGVLAD